MSFHHSTTGSPPFCKWRVIYHPNSTIPQLFHRCTVPQTTGYLSPHSTISQPFHHSAVPQTAGYLITYYHIPPFHCRFPTVPSTVGYLLTQSHHSSAIPPLRRAAKSRLSVASPAAIRPVRRWGAPRCRHWGVGGDTGNRRSRRHGASPADPRY